MTYYHATKEAATEAAAKYTTHWTVQVTLEGGNGWVITLYPNTSEVLKYPLHDLLSKVELNLGSMRQRPADYKKPSKVDKDVRKSKAPLSMPPPPPPPPPPPSPKKPAEMPPPPPPRK